MVIYGLYCKEKNMCYVGRTSDYNTRISAHFSCLKAGRHCNKGLQSDYDKGFVFEVIIIEDGNEVMEDAESRYIIILSLLGICYNIRKPSRAYSMFGYEQLMEQKRKTSKRKQKQVLGVAF